MHVVENQIKVSMFHNEAIDEENFPMAINDFSMLILAMDFSLVDYL